MATTSPLVLIAHIPRSNVSACPAEPHHVLRTSSCRNPTRRLSIVAARFAESNTPRDPFRRCTVLYFTRGKNSLNRNSGSGLTIIRNTMSTDLQEDHAEYSVLRFLNDDGGNYCPSSSRVVVLTSCVVDQSSSGGICVEVMKSSIMV